MAKAAVITSKTQRATQFAWTFRLARVIYIWLTLQLGQSWAMAAHADVTDRVTFKVPPIIMAWSEDGVRLPAASDGSIRIGAAPPANLILTGKLDAAPSTTLHPMSVDASTAITYRIASNTGVSVSARWTGSTAPDAPAGLRFEWIGAGPAAALPEASLAREFTVAELESPTLVASSDKRTAQRVGTPFEQSVGLQISSVDGSISVEKIRDSLVILITPDQ